MYLSEQYNLINLKYTTIFSLSFRFKADFPVSFPPLVFKILNAKLTVIIRQIHIKYPSNHSRTIIHSPHGKLRHCPREASSNWTRRSAFRAPVKKITSPSKTPLSLTPTPHPLHSPCFSHCQKYFSSFFSSHAFPGRSQAEVPRDEVGIRALFC